MAPDKKTARLAGLLYLILAITGGYSIMYVPSQIMVQGDIPIMLWLLIKGVKVKKLQ